MKLKAQILQATKRAEDRLSGFMRENRKLREENAKLVAENRRAKALRALSQNAPGMTRAMELWVTLGGAA